MRCWRKSTTWRGSVLIALACVALTGQLAQGDTHELTVETAIVEAIRARMGQTARVDVAALSIKLDVEAAAGAIVADPAPGARLGGPARFTLRHVAGTGRRRPRVGYATAVVRVSMEHATTARWLPRGTVLTADDVRLDTGDVGEMPLQPLPALEEAIGAKTRRELHEGQRLTMAVLSVPPLVRSGDIVVTRAIIGSVEVAGLAVARQSGSRGDRVRLVNPDTGRALQGRVVGRGEVLIHDR